MTGPADRPKNRLLGGYGTGSGTVDIVENEDDDMPNPGCRMCRAPAVLLFTDSAEGLLWYACLVHAGAIAYDVAVASTADPGIPRAERGADDRRPGSLRGPHPDGSIW